jgi:hypothetical protein
MGSDAMTTDYIGRVLLARQHRARGHHLNADCLHCVQILINARRAAASGQTVTIAYIGPPTIQELALRIGATQ